MKRFIQKIIPRKVLNLRHLYYAWRGAQKYGHPSEELFVIGVTGTSGKSTVITLLRQLFEDQGYTVGSLSTLDFYVAGKQKLNDKKMTMLGKMMSQKYLREMVDAGCDIAIVETTSEGRLQHRHRFINYDTMVLTNLYPEHIEAHGSFAAYKQAKIDIFSYVAGCKRKKLDGAVVPKIGIAATEGGYADEFLLDTFDIVHRYGPASDFETRDERMTKDGLHFCIGDECFDVRMYGEYNIANIACVIAIARSMDISWDAIRKSVETFRNIEGRIEFIDEAEKKGFQVIVDYAFEPVALEELYKVVDLLDHNRILHVCGSTGGGRDKARRGPIGKIAGERADIVYVTDEDPYDEDPMEIIEQVAAGAEAMGKKRDENLFLILDRREAIARAIDEAEKGDLVLITGKGSEQAMCLAHGELKPWDDREEARKAIASRP